MSQTEIWQAVMVRRNFLASRGNPDTMSGVLLPGASTTERPVTKVTDETVLLQLQQTIATNTSLSQFWNQFVIFTSLTIEFSHLHAPLKDLASAARKLVDAKLKSPLEPVTLSDDFSTALAAYHTAKSIVDNYNSTVDHANQLIAAKKAETQAGDLTARQAGLVVDDIESDLRASSNEVRLRRMNPEFPVKWIIRVNGFDFTALPQVSQSESRP